MLVAAVPAAIVFSCFWPYRRRALAAMGLRTRPVREVGLIIFIMVLFGVLAATLCPEYYVVQDGSLQTGNILLMVERPYPLYRVNLIPFQMLKDYWYELESGGFSFTLLNFAGNLALFVPLGLFPVLLWRGGTWRRSALVGLGTSLLIECGQYLVVRSTDIDDVMLNTLGALCGGWLYLLLRRLAPRFVQRFYCVKVESLHGRQAGNPGPAPGAGTGQL